MGARMNSWYDIKQMTKPKEKDNLDDFFSLKEVDENSEFI